MGFLKSHRRIRWWYKCFRSKKHEDFPFEPVPCLENGGKESNINMLRNNILMALSDNNHKSGSFSDGGEDLPRKKSKSRRSLSRAVKAVLFPIAAKKNRSRKSEQEKSFRSKSDSSLSIRLDKMLDSFRGKKSLCPSSNKDSLDSSLGTDSSGSSLFSSSSVTPASSSLTSSRSSSIASNSRSPSERKRSLALDFKQLEKKPTTMICSRTSGKRNGICNPILGLYLLLICLLALVLCGKALAIFCTSTCLFLIPCRFKGIDIDQSYSVIDSVDCIDIDCDEYKKRVVMEGLLERSRTTRGLYPLFTSREG